MDGQKRGVVPPGGRTPLREARAAGTGRINASARTFDTAVVAVPLVIMVVVALQPWVAVPTLLRDPLVVAETSTDCCKAYYGFISNLGVLGWIVTAATCAFGAAASWSSRAPEAETRFLVSAALVTGWLGLDDLFLLHENVFTEVGIPETLTQLGYAAAAALHLLWNHELIRRHRVGLLLISLAALGASVSIDALWHSERDVRILFEDGAKFVGISAWAGFHVRTAFALVTSREGRTVG